MARSWPFVGRDDEVRWVTGRLSDHVGTLLLGRPGVGKSALARQVRDSLTGTRIGFIAGHAVSSGTPYEAFAGVLSDGALSPTAASQVLSPLAVADRAAHWLDAQPAHPSVLFVDDLHLLDERSAQVVLALAVDGRAIVVATAPSATDLSRTAGRLWQDGWCECREVESLDDESVTLVIESVLGGPVDSATARAFRSRAQGNPLVLRELLTAAVARDGFRRRSATWTLTGNVPLSSGIRGLVTDRFTALTEDERAALDAIAAVEPVSLRTAEKLVGAELLDSLEAARLVTVHDQLTGPAVSCAHPLYGDVLRDAMPRLRLHRMRLAAARALEKAPHPSPHDLVRAALWRLDAGHPGAPTRLLSAARIARGLSLDTAERLARAAHERRASPQSAVLLAEILTMLNRHAEATEVTATLPPESLLPHEREAITYCAALGQGLLTGDTDTGAQLVAAVLASSASVPGQLHALQSKLLAVDAQFEESIEVGSPVFHDPQVAAPARALAGCGVVNANHWLGRFRQAVSEAATMRYDVPEIREGAPFVAATIELTVVCALLDQGLLDAAQERADQFHARAMIDDDPFGTPRALYCQGRVALARGRCRTAAELFSRCIELVTPFDRTWLRHFGAMEARAACCYGDISRAAALLDLPNAPVLKAYKQERMLAEAAVQAAGLHLVEAADQAALAGGVAASVHQWGVAASAYHDAVRYGAGAAILGPLQEAVEHVDGELAAIYLRHARAHVRHDGGGLTEAADDFERIGMLLFAAEAAAEAALAYAAVEDLRPARAAGGRAQQLWAQCEGATSPWLAGATAAAPLTDRERQVVALASTGLADAAIAVQLGISVRTVQTHLAHAYAKLGINSRSQLPGLPELGTDSPDVVA